MAYSAAEVKTHRYGGHPFREPSRGNLVRVLRGSIHVGETFRVLAVEGNAWRSDKRVYLDVPGDTPTWWHPWDLAILDS